MLLAAVTGVIALRPRPLGRRHHPASITRAGIVFAGTLTLGIGLVAALLPVLT